MKPRNDYVLVRRVKPKDVSEGGIFIPSSAQESRMETIIVAIGPGAFDNTGKRCGEQMADLHIGDKVLTGKYSGIEVEGDPDLILIRANEIAAILDTTTPTKGKMEKI